MTWYKAIRKLYEPLDLGSPQYYTSRWREVFDVPAYGELYDKVEESTSQWSKTMTEDQVGVCVPLYLVQLQKLI